MVKSLGHTVISIYTKVTKRFFHVDSEADLVYHLSHGPVLNKAMETLACDMYYCFGTMLAPLVAGLITCNHINFNHSKKDGDDEPNRSETDESSRSAADEGNYTTNNASSSDICYTELW
eukprot:TRINITY_DN20049_c2_g1_i4.p1 TRINITY_DN20049_c2_g1~~TRINITY_DN20049_c2_g1_i4.p1  ORF type:complete len:119 (+),score=12.83 TRINITY_DN20049_c2_g1_i4:71-427(+)